MDYLRFLRIPFIFFFNFRVTQNGEQSEFKVFIKNERILQNNKLIANTFINYFCNIKNMPKDLYFEEQTSNVCVDRTKASIEKCKDHPSIGYIKEKN